MSPEIVADVKDDMSELSKVNVGSIVEVSGGYSGSATDVELIRIAFV